jgi:dienelactone hydrolase
VCSLETSDLSLEKILIALCASWRTTVPTVTGFTTNGIVIQAELYTPIAGTSNPGFVAIAYGTDGMAEPWGARIREFADALCREGFVAMIPDYFGCTGTTPGPNALEDLAKRNAWQQALVDGATYAKASLDVDGTRVGLLGFSLGGHLCLRQRATAKVVVEFFAPELDGLGSASGLTSHAQIHHGQADELVPFHPNADNVNRLLEKEGVIVELFTYPGANHGFVGLDTGNANARTDSLRRTLDCFKKYL